MEGLENRRELMNPDRASHTILKALKARLESNQTVLVCMNCGSGIRHRIKDLPSHLQCQSCGGNMLASISSRDTEKRDLVRKKIQKKKRLKPQEQKDFKELMTSASLVREYGRNAVIVLAGRGVGPTIAGRILSKMFADEYDLYREILKAEVNFARTSQFWA
jgi:ATP-dependent Lhr-like helicase